MPIYCGAFTFSMFLSTLVCRKKKDKGLLIWLPVIPILMVSVLRYGIGADYLWVYDYGFESVVMGRAWNYERFEPGYLAINFFVNWLHGTSFWVFAIMAIIFHYFMYRFILDWSDNIALSLLVLFVGQQWLFSLNGIRQAAAIAIVAAALKYVDEGKPAKYIGMVLLASSLHFTALIFVPLYWLLRKRFSQVAVLFLGAGLLALSTLSPILLKYVAGMFGREGYFDSVYFKNRLYYVEFFIALLVAAVTLAVQHGKPEFDDEYCPIISMAVFALFAASLSAAIPNAERFDMYFTVVYVVLIPALIKYCKTQLTALFISILLIGTLGARLVYDTYVNGDSNEIAEYRCVLFESSAL